MRSVWWLSAGLGIEALPVLASPDALPCVLEQDTLSVQPRKTCLNMTGTYRIKAYTPHVMKFECQHISSSTGTLTLCLLIIFTNSLDPDQVQQNVGPELDPNCLIL